MKEEIVEKIVKKEAYNNSDILTRRFLDKLGLIAEAACDEYKMQTCKLSWNESKIPNLNEEDVYECVLRALLQIFAVKMKTVEIYYIDIGSIPISIITQSH